MAVAGTVGIILLLAFDPDRLNRRARGECQSWQPARAACSCPAPSTGSAPTAPAATSSAASFTGARCHCFIGVLAVALEVSLGTVVGGVAAYYGGWLDALLMRFTEAMLAIPSLFLLIVLAKFLGNNIPTINLFGRSFSGSVGVVIVVIGGTSWMYLARIVRANVLSIKEMDYVSASRALGSGNGRIFFTHLVPNTLGVIIVSATLGLANAILTEAYVSFLGLGVQPPTATWGNMMDEAQSFILQGVWWMWVFPSLFIVFTILCINLMGDGLRDAFDPRHRI